MYMDDAIKATVKLMEADVNDIKIRSSYNVAAINFTPDDLAESIRQHIKDFKISYEPDFRQTIADSWPNSIDDSQARNDWGWEHDFDIPKMTESMLKNLAAKYKLNINWELTIVLVAHTILNIEYFQLIVKIP